MDYNKCAHRAAELTSRRPYLQGRLAVGHRGGALCADDNRHVEAVAGEGGGGARHAEGLGERVPGFLAEDGVDQLDDLILQSGGEVGEQGKGRIYVISDMWRKSTNKISEIGIVPL